MRFNVTTRRPTRTFNVWLNAENGASSFDRIIHLKGPCEGIMDPNTSHADGGENNSRISYYGQRNTIPVCTLDPPKYALYCGGTDRKTRSSTCFPSEDEQFLPPELLCILHMR